LYLTSGAEFYAVRGDGLFSRALVTANPVSWADISAQFLYSQPHMTANFAQANVGNFIDLSLPAFFSSESSVIDALAKQPHPAGSASIELKPWHGRLRILESWMADQLHDAGTALLTDQLLLSKQGATGGTPLTLSTQDLERFVATYNQQETDLLFDVTRFFTIRAGQRYVWGDTTAPAALNITESGLASESGVLRQNVALAGATVRLPLNVRLTADFEASPGDRTYFRTSLNDYQKGRVMASWRPSSTLQVSASANVLQNQNPDPSIRYDFLSRENTASANWNPAGWKGFGLLGEYSRTTVYSNITYLIPNEPNATFTGLASALSEYRENAHTGTLLADVPLPAAGTIRPKLSLGGSFFRSSGSRPTRFWEPMARLSVPIVSHVQFWTEWRWYALTQPFYLYEGFRTNQFDLALRLSM
jgi:hypothetical protein